MTTPALEIRPLPPSNPLAQRCLQAYVAELEDRFGVTFTSGGGDERLEPPDGLFLVAILDCAAVGCGGVRFDPGATAEIKRLWVSPNARGHGVGRRLLTMLEGAAREHGSTLIRLDTNETLTEAMALYRSTGYVEVARYNDNPHAHHWFEKHLSPLSPTTRGVPLPTGPLPPHVLELLAKPCPAVMATVASDGRPVTVATWYLLEDDGTILLGLDAKRARLEHLRHDPRVSLTALDPDDWYTQVSVQGRVGPIGDDVELADIDRLSRHYTGRPYANRERPRVAVHLTVERWHGWSGGRAVTQ